MLAREHRPIALISVTDKAGIVPFARELRELGFTILSTGGTASLLESNGVEVAQVSAFAQSPEIFDGRVKTLHPKIHGGILYDRQNPSHREQAEAHGILGIDMVVVNLYQFEKNAMAQKMALAEAIEFVDVGGPAMIRAAAKNHVNTVPVVDPLDYQQILNEWRNGGLTLRRRQELAMKAFRLTARYDAMVANYFEQQLANKPTTLPAHWDMAWDRLQELRYGENPHQNAALYAPTRGRSFRDVKVLHGKELSYNNLIDVDAACQIVSDFSGQTAVAIIKHTNPCGAAASTQLSLAEVYARAHAADPKSAFGGIVALNRPVDLATARLLGETFLECIAAPAFEDEAFEVLKAKKNLRLLATPFASATVGAHADEYSVRSIQGALLVQACDADIPKEGDWQVVSKKAPSASQATDMAFAMTMAKHVKSNAIVYVKDGATIAVGAGQMSRIDAARFAAEKAIAEGRSLQGSVMASDAFFPFRDTVDLAAHYGVSAIIQPGGSVRDQESVDACNEHGMAMVVTGKRHFKH